MMSFRSRGRMAARYVQIAEVDRWRAAPFQMPPPPNRGVVMLRVRQLVESLDGAIDEGTGAALDREVESWVAGWIATVEAEYTDHCGVISVHRAQARQWLAETEVTAEHERAALARVRADFLASRSRLGGQPPREAPTQPSTGATEWSNDRDA
jgi:hypothetical protein